MRKLFISFLVIFSACFLGIGQEQGGFKNSIRLKYELGAKDSCFYTFGYQRSFLFSENHVIDMYGGFGYRPANFAFLPKMKYQKIGFYIPTFSINYRNRLDFLDFILGVRATLVRGIESRLNWEDQLVGFAGVNVYLFKERLVFGVNLGIGKKVYRAQPVATFTTPAEEYGDIMYGVFGLDVGFQF